MRRRNFLGGLGASLALVGGCGSVGRLTGMGRFSGSSSSSGHASSLATVSRSLRLDPGFFFGHDVRPLHSVAYVLDLSGSMSERSGSMAGQLGRQQAAQAGGALVSSFGGSTLGNAAAGTVLSMDKKVELVKDHLNASLRGLSPDAKFNIVMFSGDVQTLSPAMIPAGTITTLLVSDFVARLEEGGATSMMQAIEAGLSTDADDLIVLTDGLPTDATPEEILAMVNTQNQAKPRRIFTVGVGSDQAEGFLTQLAHDNGGEYLAYR
jgi:hypothetical protein